MPARDAASLLVGLLVLFHTWGVWAVVVVNMEDRVEVFRGRTAQITCMFTSEEGAGALMIRWLFVTPSGDKQQQIYYQDATSKVVDRGTRYTDRISVNGTGATGQLVLTIEDVQLEDELEFICHVKAVTGRVGEGRTKLKVFEVPHIPTIEGVQTGISINEAKPSKIGTCEVKNGFPKPNITWYRNNTPLRNIPDEVIIKPTTTRESSNLYSVTSELSMKVVKEDKDNEFYCEISYFVPGETRMTESHRINITVYYPSTSVSVWVESPKGKIKEGDSIELHCQGNGNMPSITTIKHEKSDKSWDGSEVLLENVTRVNSGVYQCSIMDTETFEEVSGITKVFVNYLNAAVVEPNNTVVAPGETLMPTCNALSSLPTHTAWFKNKEVVSKDHTLILKDISFDTAGTYVCVVTVPEIEGMETSGTLTVNVKGPPEILKTVNTEMEESFESIVTLTCHVRGFPTPVVTWTTSDGKVLTSATQTETEGGVESVVSVKVTSDITAVCNASNEHGKDAVTFNIKAISAKHTTPATTTTTTTTTTSISSTTVKAESPNPEKIKKEGRGVIIAVVIICILLLAILGSVLYFLYKKGKICGRSGKQDLTKEKSNKDNIVVEMKSDNTEEAVLLGVNGEKLTPNDQGGEYLDVQK